MNPYEVFMQGLGRFIGGASSPIDPIGTRSYQQLGSQVDSALQRNLPRSFTGAGIQNAPTNIIGQVSDLADMPEGSAKEAARNQIQRNLRMAERGLQPPGRPAGQGPGGAFRAPGVGVGGSNTSGMTFNPNTRLPGGGPFQRDYGMTRDAMRAVKGAGRVAQGLKGLAQGGATAGLGYALDLAAPTLAEEAIRGLSTITGGVSTPTWLKSVNGTNYDIRTDSGMKAYKEATGREGDNKIRGRSGAKREQQTRSSAPLPPPPPRVETNVPGRNVQPGGGGGFVPSRSSAPLPPPPPRDEAPLPTREELERRSYQNEVSRVAQQADPFFRAGGAPRLNYSADEGMAISRALYGDQLTPNTPNPLMAGLVYDETNPMMQGRNYNMENPVGVQQSSAQSLADYYRNGMMEQQTQGMGSEPGLESVLSPEDRAMYLQQLNNFRPGGPR